MKIAVLADIHANLIALRAVLADIEAWEPDEVVIAGDIVNRGPRPAECLSIAKQMERDRNWLIVRGNHEDYVISRALPDALSDPAAREVHRGTYWTYRQLGCDITELVAMPFAQSLLGPDGREVRFVHASMRGNRDGIFPNTPERTLRKQIGSPPAVLCVGHTHFPLIRRIEETIVVNVGSAGLPFDRDTRPAYARLTWEAGSWRAEIIRVQYDLEAAILDFYTTGFIPDAGPLADLVLIELREARSQLFQWACSYQERCLAGEITMETSVNEFLRSSR